MTIFRILLYAVVTLSAWSTAAHSQTSESGQVVVQAEAGELPSAYGAPPDLSHGRISTFLSGMVLLFASFGVSGWMRSRGLGIATTSLSLIGAIAAFVALRPFLHVMSTR